MARSERRSALLALIVGASLVTARAQAPSAASAAKPDIAGFHTGVTLQEALSQLKTYSPDPAAVIATGQMAVAQLGAKPLTLRLLRNNGSALKEPTEQIQLEMTLPPEPQMVWGIQRRITFAPGQEQARDSLVASLKQKYGASVLARPGAPMFWLFNEQGRPLEVSNPAYGACTFSNVWAVDAENSGGFQRGVAGAYPAGSLMVLNMNIAQDSSSPCKSLTVVRVILQASPRGDAYISSMDVYLSDGSIANRALATTAAFISNSNKTQQQELDKARRQAPPKL